MGKLRQKFNNLSLRAKFTLGGAAIFILAIVFMMVANVSGTQHIIVDNTNANARSQNSIVAQRIVHILDNAEDISAIIVNNDNIQRKFPTSNKIEQLENDYTLTYTLNNLIDNSAGISTVILYREGGGLVSSMRVNMSNITESEFEAMSARMPKDDESLYWDDLHQIGYHIFQGDKAAISLRRNIISLYTGERIGIEVININETEIADTYRDALDEDAEIFIVNGQGMTVSAAAKELLFQPASGIMTLDGVRATYNGEEYLYSKTEVGQLGWKIVRLDPMAAIYADSINIQAASLILNIALVIAACLATRLIIGRMVAPITQLSKIMESPEDDLLYNTDLPPTGNDETGRLIKAFQRMKERIAILIERIRFEQEQKHKTELLSLQAQINPHFLYNSLESVCSLIQLGRQDEAANMVKHIESFYRGTLSKGNVIISIGEELEIARQYIEIQRIRYEKSLAVEYDIDEDILASKIPKLTLQPIIENAVYHGLRSGARDGRIVIHGYHDDTYAYIEVTDDGEGFTPLDIEEYRANESTGGYGLHNTQQRLASCFGSSSGIEINSRPGHGTSVRVKVLYLGAKKAGGE